MKVKINQIRIMSVLVAFFCINCSEKNSYQNPREHDERAFDEFEKGLSEITDCTWDSVTGTMSLVLVGGDADESIAVIGLDESDNVKINFEYDCDDTSIAKASVKYILVNRKKDSPGAVTLIVDYLNGTFALGVAGDANTGVKVERAIGANSLAFTAGDAVKVRTKDSNADNIIVGNAGINVDYQNGGTNTMDIWYRDSNGAGPTILGVATGSGIDTINCRGGAGKSGGPEPVPADVAVTVYAGSDDDTITGGKGADSLYGDEGVDWIDGLEGADVMDGGAGEDTVSYALHTAGVTVSIDDVANDGNTEYDTQVDNVKKTVEILVGSDHDDTLSCDNIDCDLDGGLGVNTLDLSGETRDITLDAVDGTAAIEKDTDTGTDSDTDSDTAPLALDIANFQIFKTGAGDDNITGSTDDEVFYPGVGDDTIDGGAGSNKVDYFEADGGCVNPCTYVYVNFSTATIEVNSEDLLATNVGLYNSSNALVETDIITKVRFVLGTDGADTMTADGRSDFNFNFYGKGGNDTLTGGDLHDVLDGGAGTNTLDGGPGANLCFGSASPVNCM